MEVVAIIAGGLAASYWYERSSVEHKQEHQLKDEYIFNGIQAAFNGKNRLPPDTTGMSHAEVKSLMAKYQRLNSENQRNIGKAPMQHKRNTESDLVRNPPRTERRDRRRYEKR